MSKNILKQLQEGRERPEESREADALRDALLSGDLKGEGEEKRLNAQIPAGLHRQFKAACKEEGKSMTTVMVRLIETWLELRE